MAAAPHSSAHPPNRLAKEESPYLKQHAQNPVDWYPWGEEAFALARKENKPIFLSIGYSTCHWRVNGRLPASFTPPRPAFSHSAAPPMLTSALRMDRRRIAD